MEQVSFNITIPRFAGVFFVLFSGVMLLAAATMENPVSIQVPGSGGSSATGNNWNCPAQRQIRTVQFHSFTVNGNSYQKTLIYQSFLSTYFTESGGQVVQKTFKAAALGPCLVLAGKAGVDAIGYNNNVCSGYTKKTNAIMCPCSSGGDTVLFVNKNMIADKRAQITTPVINADYGNFTKTIVYSDFLANFAVLQYADSSTPNCLDAINNFNLPQSFIILGPSKCYRTQQVVNVNYDTSCSGKPVVVITQDSAKLIHFLDNCGTTVTMPSKGYFVVSSHAGFGFSNYPQPTTATDCEVTFLMGPGLSGMNVYYAASLAKSGSVCIDELIIYDGTNTTGTIRKRTCDTAYGYGQFAANGPLHMVFKRQPAVAGASAPIGGSVSMKLY